MIPDIFTCMPKLPKTVYIVGGGPNGNQRMHKIPGDACSIALNSSVLRKKNWTWWCCFDKGIRKYDWYSHLSLSKTCSKLFGIELTKVILQNEEKERWPDFSFKYRPGWHRNPKPYNLRFGWLRGNMSIAGCAIQFAYYGGAKEIILCGVDMYGRVRWDGFIGTEGDHYAREWKPIVPRINQLIYILKQKGVSVVSLSKTSLNVELV